MWHRYYLKNNSKRSDQRICTNTCEWLLLSKAAIQMQRRIQNPVNHLRWSFLRKKLTSFRCNYFPKKLHLRYVTELWIRPLNFRLNFTKVDAEGKIYSWDKVFKNGSSKICGRQPLKHLKWYGQLNLPQILLDLFLNSSPHLFLRITVLENFAFDKMHKDLESWFWKRLPSMPLSILLSIVTVDYVIMI